MGDVPLHSLNNIRGVDKLDGSFVLKTISGCEDSVFVENMHDFNPEKWVLQAAGNAILAFEGNAIGMSWLAVSLDPLTLGVETVIDALTEFSMPGEVEFGISRSQGADGQVLSVEVVDTQDVLEAPPTPIAISAAQQTTTTLTITTATPHGLFPGDRVQIYGVSDSRLNYAPVVVAAIPTPTQFTVTAGPRGTIPSVTAGPFASGFVERIDKLGGKQNGAAMVLENGTTTNASFFTKGDGSRSIPSGTPNGNNAVTIAGNTSTARISAAGTYAFDATVQMDCLLQADSVTWADQSVSSTSGTPGIRHKQASRVPNPTLRYRPRFRAATLKGCSVSVAEIVSAVKAGSTTATITTATPHGLTTGDYVLIRGVRDQTNFANIAIGSQVAVASVVNATTFTIAFGASATATSYGGHVVRVQGGAAFPGATSNIVQSIVRTSDVVTITTSATVSGISIGDLVNLRGVRDNATGASLGVDGAYRVRDQFSTTVVLEPIVDYLGATRSPTGANIGSTNCGGEIIKRTDLRIHFLRVSDRERMYIDSYNSRMDPTMAHPVVVLSSPTIQGAVGEDSAASGNPVLIGGMVRTNRIPNTIVNGEVARMTMTTEGSMTVANGPAVPFTEVASSARTATGNSGAISHPAGGAISGIVKVTASSGTTPTLDLTLEESWDNGTTWTPVWAAPRITGNGNVSIPPMACTGLRRWVWTIAGTSPSFTFEIWTNTLAVGLPVLRSLIDRTINPNSLGSATPALYVEGCTSILLLARLSTLGAPVAAFQIQLSYDGTNYFGIGSTVTPGSANTPAAVNISGYPMARFARAVVQTAGTGSVLAEVTLMARN